MNIEYQNEPDYLFAKINYADYCLQDGDLEKIPEIFEGKFDLQGIYPDRDEFHISEAMSFFRLMCLYFTQKGDDKVARTYLNMMEDIDTDHPATLMMKKAFEAKNSFMKSSMKKIFGRKN